MPQPQPVPQPQPQPYPPQQPPCCNCKCDLTKADVEAIVLAALKNVKLQITAKQMDAITNHVIGQLPPVVMEIQDGDETFRQEKPLGEPIKIRVEGIIKATQ